MRYFKKFCSFVLIGAIIVISFPTSALAANPKTFSDVQMTDWYYEAVSKMAEKDAITGFSDQSFRPNEAITKAEYAKMLFANLPLSTPQVTLPDDVKAQYQAERSSYWAKDVVWEALMRGIVDIGDDPAVWEQPITRSEIAYFNFMAFETTNFSHEAGLYPDVSCMIGDYGDCLADEYTVPILIMMSSGIMGGTSDTRSYLPQKTVSRAEACVIVSRIIKAVPRIDVTAYDVKHADAPFCNEYVMYGLAYTGKKVYDTPAVDYSSLSSTKKGSATSAKYGGMSKQQASEAQAVADRFVANYIRPSMTELEKACIAAEYIMANCNYASDSAKNPYNAWGALVDHAAVCTGFSYAFNFLCDRMDIGCAAIPANKESVNPSHMWNAVRIDGYWYMLDVQVMDLARDYAAENLESFYFSGMDPNFMVSSENFIKVSGMKWNVSEYPVCNYDYFT